MKVDIKLTLMLFLAVAATGLLLASEARGRTYVSGKVLTADGRVVAGGAVALEKGELHNNAFLAGGAIGADGVFKIPLPSGGPWGLHVYSENFIYFPLQVQIKEGSDNEVPVILPVDGNRADDPHISGIRFAKISERVFQIRMQVTDPDGNLGPQMLAVDTGRFKSYRLVPETGDLQDKKANFPAGVYVSPFIPLALDKEDLKTWRLLTADHQCSNGVVYNGLGESVFKPPQPHREKLACDLPGVWKSNFDKIYRFTPLSPGAYKGEQLEGELLIDRVTRNDDTVAIDFRFEGKAGRAELRLACRENGITLKGAFKLPDRSGDWIFTKLQNARETQTGGELFAANCSGCHYPDRKDVKVGPGLLGLFKNPRLPKSGRPTSAEAVRRQIIDGGEKMPPFGHLKEEELAALIEYLKTL